MTQSQNTNTERMPHMNNSLLDGLVIMTGLFIAVGGFFRSDIMMWWVGA